MLPFSLSSNNGNIITFINQHWLFFYSNNHEEAKEYCTGRAKICAVGDGVHQRPQPHPCPLWRFTLDGAKD
jgi:hypothetical protein